MVARITKKLWPSESRRKLSVRKETSTFCGNLAHARCVCLEFVCSPDEMGMEAHGIRVQRRFKTKREMNTIHSDSIDNRFNWANDKVNNKLTNSLWCTVCMYRAWEKAFWCYSVCVCVCVYLVCAVRFVPNQLKNPIQTTSKTVIAVVWRSLDTKRITNEHINT